MNVIIINYFKNLLIKYFGNKIIRCDIGDFVDRVRFFDS